MREALNGPKSPPDEGMRPGKIKDTLRNEYRCTVRRIEQIVSLEREAEGIAKRKPGRPEGEVA